MSRPASTAPATQGCCKLTEAALREEWAVERQTLEDRHGRLYEEWEVLSASLAERERENNGMRADIAAVEGRVLRLSRLLSAAKRALRRIVRQPCVRGDLHCPDAVIPGTEWCSPCAARALLRDLDDLRDADGAREMREAMGDET